MKYKYENNIEDQVVLGKLTSKEDETYLTRELDIKVIKQKKVPEKSYQTIREIFELIKSLFNQDTINVQEQFVAIYLNSNLNYMGHYISSKGGINSTIADIRLILTPAIKLGANGVIIAHNHPSGNTEPSPADIELTKKVKKSLKVMHMHLLDHMIITENEFKSFAVDQILNGLQGIKEIRFDNNEKNYTMKITRKNYFTEIEKYKSDLPKAIAETHELIAQATSDGKTWDFFEADPEMKEVELLQFEKFQEFLNANNKANKSEKKAKKPAAKSSSTKKKSTKRSTTSKNKGRTRQRKPKYKKGDVLTWLENDGTVQREKIVEIGHASTGEPVYTVQSKSDTWKYPETEIKDAIKAGTMFLNQEPVKQVEEIELEIRLIKRYKNFHRKEKNREQVMRLLASLQRAIIKKQIRKDSVFAKEIEDMQDSLIKAVKLLNDIDGETVFIEIENYEKYNDIARSEKRMLAVSYILRYIGMANKTGQHDKANRLLEQIQTAIEKKKINPKDRYYDHIKKIEKNLKAYTQKKTKYLTASETELRGLQGLIGDGLDGLFSNASTFAAGIMTSLAARYIYDRKLAPKPEGTASSSTERKTDAGHGKKSGVVSSEELKTMKFEALKLEPDFAEVIGEPSEGAAIMIYGGPGSGKSTFEVLFGKSLAEYNNKKVLIITDEEGFSKTMQEKLDRLDAYHKNIFIAEEIPGDIKSFDVVFFDSVQSLQLTPEQLEKFNKEHPRTLMVFVFQVTKDGKFKGEEEFEHIVDVVLHADQGIVTSIGKKNRFGGRGELQVY